MSEERPPDRVWYHAYGSNLLSERFLHYLAPASSPRSGDYGHHLGCADPAPPSAERHVSIDHGLYFGGHSIRWDGSVAFLRLDHDPTAACMARAYLISGAQLVDLIRQENRAATYAWHPSHLAATVHEHVELPVGDGNYNALLRLPDVDAVPAVALTTARAFDAARPPARYHAVVRDGLRERGLTAAEADEYLWGCCPA
jgi:hypothetical protein